MTRDSNDNLRATYERLLKAYNSSGINYTETMFRYLDETCWIKNVRRTNPIVGGVNAQLRRIALPSRDVCGIKRSLVVLFRLTKTVCKRNTSVMPTDASISKIYSSMNEKTQLRHNSTLGDAILRDLH